MDKEKLKQEIDELKSKIKDLENEVNKEELDCYFGSGCIIDDIGDVCEDFHCSGKNDYNQIRNKEIAEQVSSFVQIQRALLNFKCEHDPVFDWKEEKQNWTIVFNHRRCEYIVLEIVLQVVDSVWFSTKELAQAALNMLIRRGLICIN